MYRRGNAYHGAHPFFMWYWGEDGRAARRPRDRRRRRQRDVPELLGWERADTLAEAIAMARGYMGRSAQITMLHQPLIAICDMS